jgi:hypothetical protein
MLPGCVRQTERQEPAGFPRSVPVELAPELFEAREAQAYDVRAVAIVADLDRGDGLVLAAVTTTEVLPVDFSNDNHGFLLLERIRAPEDNGSGR